MLLIQKHRYRVELKKSEYNHMCRINLRIERNVFFKIFLDDISPLRGATDTPGLDFW